MAKSEITIWPQKTFKESIAIYDEWNFERHSLARTQNEEAITAFINMKQAFYEFEQWPIKGFYETFIRSTKAYLEMD